MGLCPSRRLLALFFPSEFNLYIVKRGLKVLWAISFANPSYHMLVLPLLLSNGLDYLKLSLC